MSRRILLATAVAGTLAAGMAVAPAASAGNVAWGVTIGAPGVAISAGTPYYGYRPYYRPYYRPAYRPVYVAPPVYAAPVAYSYPYAYTYPAPVVVAPRPYYGGYRY